MPRREPPRAAVACRQVPPRAARTRVRSYRAAFRWKQRPNGGRGGLRYTPCGGGRHAPEVAAVARKRTDCGSDPPRVTGCHAARAAEARRCGLAGGVVLWPAASHVGAPRPIVGGGRGRPRCGAATLEAAAACRFGLPRPPCRRRRRPAGVAVRPQALYPRPAWRALPLAWPRAGLFFFFFFVSGVSWASRSGGVRAAVGGCDSGSARRRLPAPLPRGPPRQCFRCCAARVRACRWRRQQPWRRRRRRRAARRHPPRPAGGRGRHCPPAGAARPPLERMAGTAHRRPRR